MEKDETQRLYDCKYPKESSSCSLKVFDIAHNNILCRFDHLSVELLLKGSRSSPDEFENLIKKGCKSLQNDIRHSQYRAKIDIEKCETFLKNTDIGDFVFCVSINENVKLLSKPSLSDCTGNCKVLLQNGRTHNYSTLLLRKIPKGLVSKDYIIKGVEKGQRASEIIDSAKNLGIKVETVNKGDYLILRIIGDTEQEVDDFIRFRCNSDYTHDLY